MDRGITGRVALVCGSSGGLGRATAQLLAREGCRVAVNGRNDERLKQAVTVVSNQAKHEVEGFRADVSVPKEAEDLVHRVRDRFGSVDILVCNAGGPPAVQFATALAENWRAALELNLLSTINLCRAATPIMRKHHWGRI